MRSPLSWYVLLTATCIAGPYLLGVPPRTRRDWLLLTITEMFLMWLLAGFAFLRSS